MELLWSALRCVCGSGLPLRLFAGLEELVELVADVASLCFVVLPFVGVDAQGCVWFSVSETALDGDEILVECERHAGVAVAEVVQCRLGCGELGGLGCPGKRGSRD